MIHKRSRRDDATAGRDLDEGSREEPRRVLSIPPPEHPHTWTELLTLVGAIRRIAYDIRLEAGDALRRIRDLYAEYDAGGAS
jgi:hypothetical protein